MVARKTTTQTTEGEAEIAAPSPIERQLLCFGTKTFRITIPAGCRVTFGPWSPPTAESKNYGATEKSLSGTLRVYQGASKTTENIIAVFSGITGFRDLSLGYAEQVAIEQGATIWKDDKDGYQREEKVTRKKEWIVPETPLIGAPAEEADDDL